MIEHRETAVRFMNLFFQTIALCALAGSTSTFLTAAKTAKPSTNPAQLTSAKPAAGRSPSTALGQLPIIFEPEAGEPAFTGWGGGYRMHLQSGQATFVWARNRSYPVRRGAPLPENPEPIDAERVSMRLEGSRNGIAPEGLEPTSGYSSYFHGNKRENWRTRVPHYAKVRFRDVYAGIDVVYYGNQRRLEYDFVVKPGAHHEQIRLAWDGVKNMRIDETTGDLLLSVASGEVRHLRPHIYQYDGDRKVEIAGAYRLIDKRTMGFTLARYDRTKPLVIDPILLFASHLGGNLTDDAFGVTTDSANNIYVCGRTMSQNFRRSLTSPAYQTEKRNPLATTDIGFDAFLVKLNPAGTSVIYATFLGGMGYDVIHGVSVDANGNPFLAGETTSTVPAEDAFPTVGIGAQSTLAGGPDGFVTKMDFTGTALEWSSYIGGPQPDALYAIAVLGSSVMAVGKQGDDILYAWWNLLNLGPVSKQTYGGAGPGIAYDVVSGPNNLWYVGGIVCSPNLNISSFTNYSGACDGFYMRVNTQGIISNFHYVGSDAFDEVRSLAVTPTGDVYVTGETNSSQQGDNTYGINGFQGDVFVARLDPLGLGTHFGYFGGSLREYGDAIAIDSLGTAWVGGYTQSSDFPDGPFSATKQAIGGYDAFLIRVAPLPNKGFNLLFSTYFGALVSEGIADVTVAPNGNVFFAGTTGRKPDGTSVLPQAIQPSLFTPNFGGGEFDSFIAQVASARVNVTAQRTYGPPSLGSQDPFRVFTTVTMSNSSSITADNCGLSTRLTGGAGGCFNCANVPAGQTVRRAFTTSPGPGGSCSSQTVKLGCETADTQSSTNDAILACPSTPPSQCQPSLAATAIQSPPAGGEQEFTVTIPAGCTWNLSRDQGFVEILSPAIATEDDLPSGTRQVRVRVSPNSTGAARSATLSIRSVASAELRIDQAASTSSVTISLAPSQVTLNPNGTAQFNATVSGATNTAVTYLLQPAVGTISASGLYTAPASIPTASTVQLTASSVADPTRAATATINLQPASPIQISLTPGTSSLQSAQQVTFSAIVTGTSNTAVTFAIQPAIGTITAAGLYTAPLSIAAQTTIVVTATSVADPSRFATATVILQPVGIGVTLSPSSVTLQAGQSATFTALVSGTGNTAITYSLEPQTGVITPGGVYTAPSAITSATTVLLRATSVADPTRFATAIINLQPSAINITLAPTVVNLSAGQSATFTPSVTGSSNTAVTYSLQPALGTISANGVYTAPASIAAATQVVLRVTSAADSTRFATATINLQPGAAINVNLAPATVSLFAGQSAAFTATVSGATNTGVSYTLQPAVGTITGAGVYTAPPNISAVTTVEVRATSLADTSRFAAAIITLQPAATISVTINPSNITLGPGQSVTFSTSISGTPNNNVTYSLLPATGSISASGTYTAPAAITSASTVQVLAISVADPTKAGIATISLQPNTPSTGLRFVSMSPCRLMETRPDYNFEGRTGAFGPPFVAAGETRTLSLPQSNVCPVPASARAYVLNVTLIPRGPADFVTIWPGGETRPDFFTVRSPDGNIVANSAIVRAGPQNQIQVYSSDAVDMVIDISGYFTDQAGGLTYYPLTPCRVVETRSEYRTPPGPYGPPSFEARQTRRFRFPGNPYCQVPSGAAAYSVTLTVVPPGPLQFLTAWPAGGAQPNISNINSPGGRVLANNVILPASADGSVDIFAFDRTDVLVDITGYFAPDDGQNGLSYFPVRQCRAVDTQRAAGPFGGPAFSDELTRSYALPAAACAGVLPSARAYAIHATAIPSGNPMPFVTAFPTGQPRPNASILNAFQGQTVTNSAIVPAGANGSIDVYAFRSSHLIIDIAGYFGR
ncbi:MAG: SBBP repeat-containing protein [Bryobacterales bacterium]|nr:SBBP repeat-containing protein [Bryobacterales bacterium]